MPPPLVLYLFKDDFMLPDWDGDFHTFHYKYTTLAHKYNFDLFTNVTMPKNSNISKQIADELHCVMPKEKMTTLNGAVTCFTLFTDLR